MGKHRKIVILSDDGKILKTCKSQREVSKELGIHQSYVCNILVGKIKGSRHKIMYEDDYYKKIEKKEQTEKRRGKSVILVEKRRHFVKTFDSVGECAKYLEISISSLSHILGRGGKYKGYQVILEKDFDKDKFFEESNKEVVEEKPAEIVRKKAKDFYINILVGLVNCTLIEGATYNINGSIVTYNRERQALVVGDILYMSRERLINEVIIELPLLEEKEINFLKNLLIAFDKVKGIRKCNDITPGFEFIRIETEVPKDNVDLPTFREGKYYKNLEQNRLYTVDELNL